MQAVTRRHLQVIRTGGEVDVFQPSDRSAKQVRRKPFRLTRQEERLCMLIGKRFNHGSRLTCHVTLVKRLLFRQSKMTIKVIPALPGHSRASGNPVIQSGHRLSLEFNLAELVSDLIGCGAGVTG
jgi:hypothetical protein